MSTLDGAGLLLAPGAGAGREQSALVAVDHAAAALGASVVRMDFAYRLAGRRAPDREPMLLDAVRAQIGMMERPLNCLFVGGRSMGGRMCSLVAPGSDLVGLVLVSYPLHPPGRPEKLRVDHFPALDMPCLFVSGTGDAFGTPEEFGRECAAIPGPVSLVWIDGKDHSLRGADRRVAQIAVDWMVETWASRRLHPGRVGREQSS
ncbi:MAG: alpha/beta hydrolase [Acidimicrobiales bacterium]